MFIKIFFSDFQRRADIPITPTGDFKQDAGDSVIGTNVTRPTRELSSLSDYSSKAPGTLPGPGQSHNVTTSNAKPCDEGARRDVGVSPSTHHRV